MLTLEEFRKSRCHMEKNLLNYVVYEPEKFSCTAHFQMLNNGYDQWIIITLFLFLCYCLTKMLFNSKSRHTNFLLFCMLFGCPTTNFWSLSRGQPCSPDIKHWILIPNLDLKVTQNLVTNLWPSAWPSIY